MCSALPMTMSNRRSRVRHHSTFAELEISVQNGCQVCALLRIVILEYYAYGRTCSVEEAGLYHRQLDQHPESSPFFVEAVLQETISGSEPQPNGIRGLLYLRIDVDALDAISLESPDPTTGATTTSYPVDGICPFVQVSSLPGTYVLLPGLVSNAMF